MSGHQASGALPAAADVKSTVDQRMVEWQDNSGDGGWQWRLRPTVVLDIVVFGFLERGRAMEGHLYVSTQP